MAQPGQLYKRKWPRRYILEVKEDVLSWLPASGADNSNMQRMTQTLVRSLDLVWRAWTRLREDNITGHDTSRDIHREEH